MELVIFALEENEIEYMLVGSLASMIYGDPRLTRGIDFVVEMKPEQLTKISVIFPNKDFYCPPIETISDEMLRRGQFNLIHHTSGFKIDIVFRKQSPHSLQEFKRRKKIELWPGFSAYVATPEDVIIKKLEYFREGRSSKHLLDIKSIRIHTILDQKYLEKWIQSLGLEKEWTEALVF